jgi:serine/threonine protein kinase
MSSPPGPPDDGDDGTVMRPVAPAPGATSAPAPARPAPATRPISDADTLTVIATAPGGPSTAAPAQAKAAPTPTTPATASAAADPHSPTLSAASLASGAAPVGNALPIGSFLGEFELTSVIGEGGFGIVYMAVDHSLQRRVALKEYMPSSLAERTSGMQVSSLSEDDEETFRKGLDSFINEARLLAQFDHPSLVKVHRFWEANGTAYMVMPFYEGPTLKDVLRDMGGPPDEAWLLSLLEPVTEALAVIHAQQCYHRDIAPDNILLLAGSGRPLLLDFGAARRVIGDYNQALTVILKPGYAPIEQYAEVPNMKQGPWTDVYALAAVVFFAITGRKPPAAVGRLLNDQYVPLAQHAADRYSAGFLAAIDRALAVKPDQRTQNIDAFRASLGFAPLGVESGGSSPAPTVDPTRRGSGGASGAGTGAGSRTAPPAPPPAPAAKRGPGAVVGLGVLGLAIAGGVGWWATRSAPAPTPAAAAAASAPASAAAAVPASAPSSAVTAAASAAAAAPVSAPPGVPPASPFTVLAEFQRVVQQQTPGFTVEAQPSRTRFRIGSDTLSFSFSSTRDGYYYVLSHSPDNELFQLFPNAQAPGNQALAARSITLPQPGKDPKTRKDLVLNITEPAGPAQLLVIVSKYPRDFSALGGSPMPPFTSFPTGESAQAMAAARGAGLSIYAGQPVCPPGPPCVDEFGAALVEFSVVR